MPADDAVSPMQGDRYPAGYIRRTDAAASGHDLVAEKLLHPDAMGVLVPGRDKHFYSSGAFNLIQLILYILKIFFKNISYNNIYSIFSSTNISCINNINIFIFKIISLSVFNFRNTCK